MNKRIVSFLLAAAIMVQPIAANAVDFEPVEKEKLVVIPETAQSIITSYDMGDVVETHELYGADDEVVATCLDFEDAYLIYLNNGTVIEFSDIDNSDYYGLNEKTYYGGPLSYYKEDNDSIIELSTGMEINESTLLLQTETLNEIALDSNCISVNSLSGNVNETQVLTPEAHKLSLPYSLNTSYHFNNDNEYYDSCVAHSMAILIDYYNKRISQDYIPSEYDSSERKFFKYIINTYFTGKDTYHRTREELVEIMTSYCTDHNLKNSVYSVESSENSLYSETYYSIGCIKRPIILYLKHSDILQYAYEWNIDHAVVVHGVSDPAFYSQNHYAYFYVNDGWGHNNKAILYNELYMDSVTRFKK